MGQSVGACHPERSEGSGAKLKSVIETAREQVAELIGAHPMDVIFTSCATESNSAAIAAALKANPTKRHIVTSQVEHSSVLNYCMALSSGEFTSPRGGVKPPLHEPSYRVTYCRLTTRACCLFLVQLTTDN